MALGASWTPLVFTLPMFCAFSEALSPGIGCAAFRALARARFCALTLLVAGPAGFWFTSVIQEMDSRSGGLYSFLCAFDSQA